MGALECRILYDMNFDTCVKSGPRRGLKTTLLFLTQAGRSSLLLSTCGSFSFVLNPPGIMPGMPGGLAGLLGLRLRCRAGGIGGVGGRLTLGGVG